MGTLFEATYTLHYLHRVTVGLVACGAEAGLRIARQAFDDGTIWDDTEAMPLLYDGFEEQEGSLDWDIQAVEAFSQQDYSVRRHRAEQQALQTCRMLVAAYRSGEGNGGSIAWEDLDAAHGLAQQALALLGEPAQAADQPVNGAGLPEGSPRPDDDATRALRFDRPARLAVVIDGGIVQAVVSDHPFCIEVAIVDYDTEGAGCDKLTPVQQGDGTCVDAVVACWKASPPAIDLDAVFAVT
jgi:hypothetical protein